MRILQGLVALLMTGSIATAQEVSISHGDIYLRPTPTASGRRVTNLGHIKKATLSPGKDLIAFVQDTPADSVETGLGNVPADEIWVISPDGSGARRILHGRT